MSSDLPRPLLLLTALLLVSRIGLELHEALVPSVEPTAVRWFEAPEALLEAEKSGRPLLYDFGADWCRPCLRMSREVFADETAGGFVNESFVPLRVEDGLEGDGLDETETEALRQRFNVEGFPTLLIVHEGEVLGRLVGYPGREETLAFLRANVPASP